MKLHTIALGCQMSAADADEMAMPLARRGFTPTSTPDDADAILISTCTVRQHAEDRALSLIGSLRPWKEERPERVLIVAGCAAERLGPWIQQRFPFVDLIVGAKSIDSFPQLVEDALGARFDFLAETAETFDTHGAAESFSPVSSYLTIMRGCNYSCSYCIVPAVRGRELYRPVSDILNEARRKIESGARELTLLGQTVNSYESINNGQTVDFADLLRLIDPLPGLKRLRFMSPHPYYVDQNMIAAMAQCPTVCPQLHLPVQSGCDRLLKLMRRNYTRAQFMNKVRLLRQAIPDIVLSTDIIVGFPTETEDDFEETLSLVAELEPASAYCFKYSPRQSTESSLRADDVPQIVKEERLGRLNALVDRLTERALDAHVGQTVEALDEQGGFGRTRGGFKMKWTGPAQPGQLVRVTVAGATRRTLLGDKL